MDRTDYRRLPFHCDSVYGRWSGLAESLDRACQSSGRNYGLGFDSHRHPCRLEMGAFGRNHIPLRLVFISCGNDPFAASPERICFGDGAAGGILYGQRAFATAP